MSKITMINRAEAKNIRMALEKALKGFGLDMGVVASVGSGRFSPHSIKFNVEISITDGSGIAGKAKSDFEYYARTFGMSEDDFGKPFIRNGNVYTICGIQYRNWKYPVLGKNPRGKVYKFAAHSVKAGLINNPKKSPTATVSNTENDEDEDNFDDFYSE